MNGIEDDVFYEMPPYRFILQIYKAGVLQNQYPTYSCVSDDDFVTQVIEVEKYMNSIRDNDYGMTCVWTVPSIIQNVKYVGEQLIKRYGAQFGWRISTKTSFYGVGHTSYPKLENMTVFKIEFPSYNLPMFEEISCVTRSSTPEEIKNFLNLNIDNPYVNQNAQIINPCELCNIEIDNYLWSFYPGFRIDDNTGCDHRLCLNCVKKYCVPRLITGGINNLEPIFIKN